MPHDIEQAMWYINVAAAVVLFARLYAQGLVRVYPFLFAYLFADTLQQIAGIWWLWGNAWAFGQRPHIYAQIYFVSQTVKVALAIFVVLELYKLTLAQQLALARFGRRMPGYLFPISVVFFGLVILLLHFDGAGWRRGAPLVEFLRFERSLDLFAFIALNLIGGFMLCLPARVRRNVVFWLGGLLLYWYSRWEGLLLHNRFGQRTHELNVAELAVSLACFIGWSLMLTREGEKEIVVTEIWGAR